MHTNTPGSVKIFVDSWSIWRPSADKPDLSNIPAMQRRRLGPLARVVFHVLGQCADTSKQEPVIFSSLMGEIQRTQGILTAIAAGEPVSPTAFSLSVHNAISGLWSMIHNIKAPMIAISPNNGSPVPALLEAAGILQEKKYPAVNIVLYEEDYPGFYSPFLTGPDHPCALGLRVVAPDLAGPQSQQLCLKPLQQRKKGSHASGPLAIEPLLDGSLNALNIAEENSSWRLECKP